MSKNGENFEKSTENLQIAEVNYDESDKEIIEFLNKHPEIYMDFDFLPELAAVNVESSLIPETDTETADSIPKFETSGSNSEQQLWG